MIITTPIPYTNAAPHLGHLLEAVFNDCIARFYRTQHTDVILTMGLDQHGIKIYEKALENNTDPAIFVKETGKTFSSLWETFDISNDVFIQTHDQGHQLVSQIIWEDLYKKGYIYKKSYTALYCVGCEDFKTPSNLTPEGTCQLHPNMQPVEMSEENYFFKLSIFQDQILAYLHSANIKPEHIRQEWINFTQDGLHDISCSREKKKMPWGISVPNDDDQVMYVWFEALINYLTACVSPKILLELAETLDENQKTQLKTRVLEEIRSKLPVGLLYFGKDIAKFHLVIFTGLLLGLDMPLPLKSLCHGFINDSEGRKMSKSLGNVVIPQAMVDTFGIDGTRFILLHDINIDGDTNFDWNTAVDSYNSHLANNIGNLVMRVTTLIEKLLDGKIDIHSPLTPIDNEVFPELDSVNTFLQEFKTRDALEVVLEAARFSNEYLEQTKPWQKAKEGKNEDVKHILTNLALLLDKISDKLELFLPETAQSIKHTITAESITKATPLFQKIERE